MKNGTVNVASMPLSKRLIEWRKSHRWTRAMASEFLDVKLRTYEQWEQGLRSPQGIGLKTVEKLIEASALP